ncbi:MAG: glycosyltransferase [Desulfobacterales bacterium]|nr:glycosyltransferase [Desulfobacterales bacterium]
MNYRVLEVLASGGFLLTDYKEDIKKYFDEDKELVIYNNETELIEKISLYLENELKKENSKKRQEKDTKQAYF